jgi:FtsP/CotA-like multicopper oxidase with cupredoxin domain
VPRIPHPSRRQILLGAVATLALRPGRSLAAAPLRLTAEKRLIEVDRKPATVMGFNTKLARFTAGERFAVRLDNHLDEPTLIHWHGLTPPGAQDGTPDLSQPALPPGQSYAYDFPLTRAGTFWMHSHRGFQRSKLLAAPLIIADPADKSRDEQEVVIFLIDFSFRPPEQIFADLTRGHGAMAGMDHDKMAGMDHGQRDHAAMGPMDHDSMAGMSHAHMDHGAMAGMDHARHGMAGDMPMGMDINDIDFDAYLANDRTLDDPEVVRVESGGRVRLRIINGASATNFWIDLGGLAGELIAVDGDAVVPVRDRRFPLAMAQRLDLRLALPPGQGAYPILALREGATERTGVVLATKAARIAKLAPSGEAPTRPLDLALEERLQAAQPLAPRQPDRTLNADLTGDMMRFVWGINGARYGADTPLTVKRGERVALVMRNRTSMAHPMHLHGHHFQVVAIDDRRLTGAMRDTVLVPAGGSVTVAFDADNPGRWAFHCHNEYHMMAGMMTSVRYV